MNLQVIEKEDYLELRFYNHIGKIDKEDLDKISNHTWRIHQGYFYLKGSKELITMQQIIFGEKSDPKLMIDHINRDRLDNRKSNLREVTRSINATNAPARSDKTQTDLPRGVTYRPENKELRKDGRGQKRYESFEVQWSVEGKRRTKTFSVKKYGSYEKAREEAIAFREQKMKELKI